MPALIEPDTPDTISQLEIEPLAYRFSEAYWRALKAEAEGSVNGLRHAMRNKYQLLNASPARLDWHDLSYAEQLEPGSGFEVYAHIKQFARDDLESGERAADVVANAMMRPWIKVRYLALRESFIEDWKPTGSIEIRLIEMMAQLYSAYEHWMELSVQRVEIQCQEERRQIEMGGKWRPTGVNGDVDAQQAAEMADRYNRLFLRTLRQLRDLRRYAVPVTINNPQQVNIAADGGQQVNVQKNKQSKGSVKKGDDSAGKNRRKAASKPKREQPALKSPAGSIRMNPAKDKKRVVPVAPGSRRLRAAR